jgi:hypothetical protein
VTAARDERADAHIDELPPWRQHVCRRRRDLIHRVDPEIEETIKRTVQPYFVLEGNVCARLAAKNHVSLFIYDPIAPDPHGIVTGGHGNKTARTIAFYDGDTVDVPALAAILTPIVANNRAGGCAG